jgi:hypothetical protein
MPAAAVMVVAAAGPESARAEQKRIMGWWRM